MTDETKLEKDREKLYKIGREHHQMRMRNSIKRSLSIARPYIEEMFYLLSKTDMISYDVKRRSEEIYKEAVEKNLVKGRGIEGVVTASYYIACREKNIPRTLDEISAISKASKKEIRRIYRFLLRMLGIKLPVASPMEYVDRFCDILELREDTRKKAVEIVNEAIKKDIISGKSPISVAAASIYIASVLCNDKRTQKTIAASTGVSEVTIRNRYNELKKKLNIKI